MMSWCERKMEFVDEYDSHHIAEDQQDEDLYKVSDKAELLHSNSCLRTLCTDWQESAEMEEDSNATLRAENSELKKQIQSLRQMKQDIQLLENELEVTRAAKADENKRCSTLEANCRELEKENETLRRQVEAHFNEVSSFLLKKEKQENEITELTCVLRAYQQQLEEDRFLLEQKDDIINQRDLVIQQHKDMLSEYITINQGMKDELKDLNIKLALASISREGSFMRVDTMLACPPECSVSLGEELGIPSVDQMMPEEEQKEEEEEDAGTQEEQAVPYMSK
ncbi:synaptonemal complex protein 1-like isoform X1, partial [Clarias magur]